MTPRGILTTIGATALGVGLVIGGGAAIPDAFAQESTPAVEAPAQAEQAADPEARRAQAYDSFVAALAGELGADETEVDAAIRTALKDQVAAQEAAGNLDAEMASELQTMIDEAESPLMLGMGGPGGFGGRGEMHGFIGRGGFEGRGGEHHGPRDRFVIDGRDDNAISEPVEGTTPSSSLPSADDASDQSTPVETAPAESVAI